MIRYQFKVYGLDAMLNLPPRSDKHALIAAMKGHVLQFGETAAICLRKVHPEHRELGTTFIKHPAH